MQRVRWARRTACLWPPRRCVAQFALFVRYKRLTLFLLAAVQVEEGGALLCTAKKEPPARARALEQRALTELLLPAIEVLERRRLAGTLLYGKCAPHEEEWQRHIVARCGGETWKPDACAPSVGYEAYLKAARLAVFVVYDLVKYRRAPPPQLDLILDFMASAIDLIRAPRPHENVTCQPEIGFFDNVSQFLDETRDIRSPDDSLGMAWHQLLSSGVFARRQLKTVASDMLRRQDKRQAKLRAVDEASDLRPCAHCGAKEVHASQLKRCGACNDPVYCSKECQTAAWPAHKAACKAARKAAAAGASGT